LNSLEGDKSNGYGGYPDQEFFLLVGKPPYGYTRVYNVEKSITI
jgi:hypothetical protein